MAMISGRQILQLLLRHEKKDTITVSEIETIKTCYELNISGKDCKRLPATISKLEALKTIFLKNTSIKELPEELFSIPYIEQIEVRDTPITKLPSSVAKAKHLKTLNLSGTKIRELPDEIGTLTNLRSLDLSKTAITRLPESICELQSLNWLDLSETLIEELPNDFWHLQALQKLLLRDTHIRALPDRIGEISSLQIINIAQTNVSSLPIPFNVKKLPIRKEKAGDDRGIYICGTPLHRLINHQALSNENAKVQDVCDDNDSKGGTYIVNTANSLPSVFISYNWEANESLADELEAALENLAVIHRDKKDINDWGNIKEFMKTIRKQDLVVLLISDQYLKSQACLYEVLELMKNEDWWAHVMSVVDNNAKHMYTTRGRLQYVQYWTSEYSECEKMISDLQRTSTAKSSEELKRIEYIRDTIDEFIMKISEMKNPNPESAIKKIRLRVSEYKAE